MTSFNVRAFRNALTITMLVIPCLASAEVIFEENFNDQADFTSTMHATVASQKVSEGRVLPEGWDALYQGTQWSPETGYPNNHASLEILESNSDKAIGGSGKSAVNWRESYSRGWNNWASDSQLIKLLGREYSEIYVEFWVSFSENWYGRDHESSFTSKIFRVGSWSGDGDIFNGALDAIGPVFFWDYKRDKYGMINIQAFRGGPWGENYMMDTNAAGLTTVSNYGSSTIGMSSGGENPKVLDQINGGYLADIDRYDFITHDQLFGPAGHWTKVAFYVKLNSAPGVADGVMMQWINDQRIKVEDAVPWIGTNIDNKVVGWNYIAIGGNDYFQPYPNDKRFEDWYAIDDVVIRNDIPSHLKETASSSEAPNPPLSLTVE